jgi:hypothetical protein
MREVIFGTAALEEYSQKVKECALQKISRVNILRSKWSFAK